MDENQKPLVPAGTPPSAEVATSVEFPGEAECMFKKLMAHIADFEQHLQPDQEVGGTFVTFGNRSIYITGIGYHGNDMIIFYGNSDKGDPIKVMQHISQTNVLLTALKKRPGHKQAKRIGFKSDDLRGMEKEGSSLTTKSIEKKS